MSGTVKIVLTILVAVAGVGFLAVQSIGDVEYYAHVEEITAKPDPWLKRKTIQVHGFARAVPVKPEIVDQQVRRSFELTSAGQAIRVVHEGVIPDTFKEEAETVVKGTLSRAADGGLLLTTVGGEQGIMAKCPSKYEGKK
jgi:cytochrome c-type biogenesis protein CcmE